MKTNKTKLDTILNKVAKTMMDSDTWQWPPQCSYFFYQPTRPQQMKTELNGIDEKQNEKEY